ncbi:hypothetical protein EXE48_13485 [Halorubrum sp. ASP1]|uniref:hypothetical protein n=1 Tax=Halorubrum sp. ASP1 TaxID=2518114 RepID=UPI0010F905C2|nr:hypothetical protein [Halorubrum sp. ASP1]TKX59783.1 hypothetical protein EXE48_13485 [Halorubrum sp. ASP1]
MSESFDPDHVPSTSRFSVTYRPEQGSRRRLQFVPREDSTGWWLIELRDAENRWQIVGREPLTTAQIRTQPLQGLETSQHRSTGPSRPLELFKIVAKERAWQILQTVSLLDEPVRREQLERFVTAYDHGDTNTDQPIDPDLKVTLDEAIKKMAQLNVIEATPDGITSGPQFGHAFATVVIS